MLKTTRGGSRQTLRTGLSVLVFTCLVSTVGYVLAGWSWLDAAYMVAITIFGVGYGEVHPVDGAVLKLFTMGVIVAGCSSVIYVIGGVVQLLAEGEIERMLGVRTRSRDINRLNQHTIICGYGRVGQMLAAELEQKRQSFVVIDNNPDRVNGAIDDGFLAMEGDAVDDDCLQKAGIFRASVLATVLPDDAANVFITLTARDLSSDIRIIARAESPLTERKLIRSGATSVVIPAAIGAVRIAQLATDEPVQAKSSDTPARSPHSATPAIRTITQPESLDKPFAGQPTGNPSEDIEADVEELANMASDLSRTVAEKRIEQVREHEQEEQGSGLI